MTSITHPDEVQLFDYVEGEPTAPEIAAHVHECPVCAGRVAELEAGRDALRSAPLLNLPPRRSLALLEQIDRMADERRERVRKMRDRPSWAGPFSSPKRLLAILTPVAAIIAVVTVFASTNGKGDEQAVQTSAKAGQTTAAGGGGGALESQSATAAAPVRSIAGKPGQIARYLSQLGFDAQAVDGRVEVRGTTEQKLRDALKGVEDGPVPVVLMPS